MDFLDRCKLLWPDKCIFLTLMSKAILFVILVHVLFAEMVFQYSVAENTFISTLPYMALKEHRLDFMLDFYYDSLIFKQL